MSYYENPQNKIQLLLKQSRELYAQKQFAKGLKLLEQCMQAYPDNALLIYEEACFLYQLGQIEHSISSLKKSVKLEANAQNHSLLATLLADTAEPEQASFHHFQAFKLKNSMTFSAYGMALNGDYEVDSDAYQLINSCLNKTGQDARDYARLNFALAQIHLKQGDQKTALEYFHTGNQYCQSYSRFDIDIENEKVDRICNVFNSFNMNTANQEEHGTDTIAQSKIAFIVGLPRSGSTLLEQMLNAHSSIKGIGESTLISSSMKYLAQLQGKKGFQPADVQEVAPQHWIQTSDFLKQEIKNHSDKLVVDKQLFNYLFLGCAQKISPNSLFIDIRRNPADIFRSCYMTLFSAWPNFTHSATDFVVAYKNYRKLMALWKSLYPHNIISIHYEKLVDEPKANLSRILELLGLAFEEQCLDFHKAKNSVLTASQQQVRKPLYKSSVGAWGKFKKHFPEADELLTPLSQQYKQELAQVE